MLSTPEVLSATVTCTPCSPFLPRGELLGGRYEIECCLGVGGMASVYRARHVGLNQPVAVKVISPAILDAPGAVERFMREARAATRLKGTHIVRVFDVGTTADGAPYMVMELLEGQDLGEVIDEGYRPSVEEAVDYILQACEALAEVHGVGMVHRDLKPPNMFVTTGPDGLSCLKLIDFGISRVDSPLAHDSLTSGDQSLVLGSPGYMAPEQMESAATTDSRSDIWALGAIAYELFLGRVPYAGDSLSDIYTSVLHGPPVLPSSARPEIPTELDEIILKCLRVMPEERYANVAQLALALVPYGNEHAASRAGAVRRVFAASQPPPPLIAKLDVPKTTTVKPPAKAGERSPCRVSSPPETPRHRRRARLVAGIVAAVGLVGAALVAYPNSPASVVRHLPWGTARAAVAPLAAPSKPGSAHSSERAPNAPPSMDGDTSPSDVRTNPAAPTNANNAATTNNTATTNNANAVNANGAQRGRGPRRIPDGLPTDRAGATATNGPAPLVDFTPDAPPLFEGRR